MNYRFFAAAWLLGIPGVIVVAVLVLPGIVANRAMAMPLWAAQIASVARGGLLLALAILAVHLPAAFALLGDMPLFVAVCVVAANSAFGVVTGWLYWRFGLEAAMLAHTRAHAIILVITS